MKTFLFVTHLVRGKYHYVTADGEEVSYCGISLNLGTSTGETVQEAWAKLLDNGEIERSLPEVKIRHAFGYEIADDGVQVMMSEVSKVTIKEDHSPKPLRSPNEKYETKVCQWCHGPIPSNGAAQFSHLKKHINELVAKKFLDKEQANAIHSVKLTPDMEKIFLEAFKK